MNGVIEALYLYDDHRNVLLSHTYTGRPLSANSILSLYLEQPAPQPNLIYLPNTNPPTLLFSLTHANLLCLVTASSEIEPLLVLEFMHRVIDALEDFLGAPLLAVNIENSYDVVAQILSEVCDAGMINTTEPNALRELVEIEGWMGKLLGSINLPGYGSLSPYNMSGVAPALPWRRPNVRHTSNEMYADVVETLSVTLAPSGRPISAFANGTIAFTSKVSGVPDITLTLTSPSGKHNIGGIMELPVFHPCVRLNKWRERPGELSFIPPDGRFILAGYEVDLLPFTGGKSGSISNNLKLPVSLEVKSGLGATGADFEIRLQAHKVFGTSSSGIGSQLGRGGPGRLGAGLGAGPQAGTAASPLLDDLTVTVPLPAGVRNLSEVRPSKGDASFNPGDRVLEWHIPAKEMSGPTSYFGLRCTVVGPLTEEEDNDSDAGGLGFNTDFPYNEPYQSTSSAKAEPEPKVDDKERDAKKVAQNKILMPTSASVSFSVKGWLASGLKVESIVLDIRKSHGVQRVGMLSPWVEAFPSTASQIIQEIDHTLGYKLTDIIQHGPSRTLTETTNSQPAIMATSILILRILEREFNFKVEEQFDFTLGHSLGEFAALIAGGYISFEDSLYLVHMRARAMSEATRRAVTDYGGEYGMIAVITEPPYLKSLIKTIQGFVGPTRAGDEASTREDLPPIEQVSIANINSQNQIVLSGSIERIRMLIAHVRQFLGHDPRAVRLNSDSPFHSPIMKPAVSVMHKLLSQKSRTPGREDEDIITFPGRLPCISNVNAREFQSKEQLKDLLARSCLETVQWWNSIRYLDQEVKIRRWVGIGPGYVGRNLVGKEVGMRGKDMVKGGGVWAITDPSEIEEVLRGLEETNNIKDEDGTEAERKEQEEERERKRKLKLKAEHERLRGGFEPWDGRDSI
ncbi:unnamed protein product [Clonostachys rosea f. rosea IK726]|uniref:Uncharacterized protein n=1 Tax=Clonostachys rosea f. rosea IK726 TaxID=1349383 RepID=A0ACA9TRH8_BIOOC|nr:unnamed protein product [Clonostachys rosea f. rosea IK726]